MRHWFDNTIPPITRVLLVESGPRLVTEKFGPVLRMVCGGAVDVDLLTCFPAPREDSAIAPQKLYATQQYATPAARKALRKELQSNGYQAMAILCADSPVLARWKWWLALRLPVKVLVVNENADCFWLDRAHWLPAKRLLGARWGLQGTASLRTLGELALFPLVVVWLLAYALFAHTRRGFRVLFGLDRPRTAQ
ncbi:MAG: hypothetical protein MUF01_11375 [Bryobacterales bacterium]|jgi:hypothetical protein|nr:hypothetical protein [Bryobacterales bacterium]